MTLPAANICIRQSFPNDLKALVGLELCVFASDRFTEEHIDYLLKRARATVFVAENDKKVIGAAYLLWRKNAQNGRLYNFAVDPDYQNRGIGDKLLRECEFETTRRGFRQINLEVRADNVKGIRFYEIRGFHAYKQTPDFYDDGSPAIRMKKRLNLTIPEKIRYKIPYYSQTLGFTCGSACLMMAMKYFQPDLKHNRILEMNLWKEATLIFMTSGIGGTDSFGIALAAARRNFPVRILSSTEKTPFMRSVRIPAKREVIRLVHDDMKNTALKIGVAFATYDFTFEDIKSALLQGWIPISLISTYRLTGLREPHWVVITGFDKKYVYIHDPYEPKAPDTVRIARNVKFDHAEFHRMSRYGKDVYRCTIFIGAPATG